MLRMLALAAAATAALVATSPAYAGLASNGTINGYSNGLMNGYTNGTTANAVIAHSPPSDFCAQNSGDAVVAHSPPSDLCAHSVAQPVGLSLGGVDGMKVMSIELLR